MSNRFHTFKPGKGPLLDPTCGPAEWWIEFPMAQVIKVDLHNADAADVLADATVLPFRRVLYGGLETMLVLIC